MKRGLSYTVLSSVVIFAVYSLIVFLIKEERTVAFWVSYICTLVAIILADGLAAWIARCGKKSVAFLHIPIYLYCSIFIIVELIIGLIFALFVSSVKMIILFEGVLYAVFLLLQLSALQGKEVLESMEAEMADSTHFINGLRLEADNLYINAKGTAVEKKLKELADAFKYSDPVSSPALQQIEARLADSFYGLKEKIYASPEEVIEEADKVLQILGERNRSCKAFK